MTAREDYPHDDAERYARMADEIDRLRKDLAREHYRGPIPRLSMYEDPTICLLDVDLMLRADPMERGKDLMTSLTEIFGR